MGGNVISFRQGSNLEHILPSLSVSVVLQRGAASLLLSQAQLSQATTLQSLMNANLSLQKSRPCRTAHQDDSNDNSNAVASRLQVSNVKSD